MGRMRKVALCGVSVWGAFGVALLASGVQLRR